MMWNTSFSATVVTAGVVIPARLTIAVPTNTQWKGLEKSRTQARPRNATRYVTWYLFLVMKARRVEMSEINTKHHKWTHTSLTFRLLCLADSLLESRHTSYTKDLFVSACTGKIMKCRKNSNTVSRYLPLAILASRPLKTQNPTPARNWNSRFPLLFLAPIPNIATKISHIPHPAKPIVDPQGGVLLICST